MNPEKVYLPPLQIKLELIKKWINITMDLCI